MVRKFTFLVNKNIFFCISHKTNKKHLRNKKFALQHSKYDMKLAIIYNRKNEMLPFYLNFYKSTASLSCPGIC